MFTLPHHGKYQCLPDAFDMTEGDDIWYIDLFAAVTAEELAWVLYLLEEELDTVSPVIGRRIND